MPGARSKVNCQRFATKLSQYRLVHPIMGTLRWADLRLAALTSILVLAAYTGVVQGFNATHWARNLPEMATATALLGCGMLGLFALIAILQKHRFARSLIEFWGALTVATAIMWPVVFANATVYKGVAGGGAASLLFALIIWLWGTLQTTPVPREVKTEKAPAPAPVQVESRESAIDRELAELKRKMRAMEPMLVTTGPTRL